jgi:hypothetical protein
MRDTSLQDNTWHFYKNQSQGMSIQYPSDWAKAITKNSIRFSPTSNNNSDLSPVSLNMVRSSKNQPAHNFSGRTVYQI